MACCNRVRGDDLLKEDVRKNVYSAIRKKLFIKRVVKTWRRLPREIVDITGNIQSSEQTLLVEGDSFHVKGITLDDLKRLLPTQTTL